MVSFAALRATARRSTTMMNRFTQKRSMGLGAAPPPPEWTGIDKVVRSVFPYDYQIAAAILGTYTGFFVLYKIKSAISGKKPEEPVTEPVAKAETTTVAAGEVPDVDSPEFEKFLENLLENEEQLKAMIEKAA